MFFALTILIVIGIYFFYFRYGRILMKERDRIFQNLAHTYNLNLCLDHENYSYDSKVSAGKSFFALRTLSGVIGSTTLVIQDRLNEGLPVLARIKGWRGLLRGPSSLLFYRFYNPFTSFGRLGAQTIVSVNGSDMDLSNKEFTDVIAFASQTKISSLLDSFKLRTE